MTTRETFQISRSSEYFEADELTKQFGHSMAKWPAAIVAELIDNSLDHCEEVGVLPEVRITLSETGLTIVDNGQPANAARAMPNQNPVHDGQYTIVPTTGMRATTIRTWTNIALDVSR